MKKIDSSIILHLLKAESVGLIMHINPDWDCLGSCLALREALRGSGVRCDILADEPLSSYLSPWDMGVKVFSGEADYACLCTVDVGVAGRIGRIADCFLAHGDRACIDHHIGGGDFAPLSYVDSSAPATGEIIYDMLKAANIRITPEIAKYIYCAISADTGSFRYPSTTAHTLRIAAEITEMGVNTAELCDLLYGRKTLKELRLQAEAIHTLRISGGGRIGTAFVSGEMYKKYNATKTDTEALAALPRELDGVVMSAFLTQRSEDEIRVNLRSEGDYNIQPVAVKFGGGGHIHASGCTIAGSDIEAARTAVEAELEKLL